MEQILQPKRSGKGDEIREKVSLCARLCACLSSTSPPKNNILKYSCLPNSDFESSSTITEFTEGSSLEQTPPNIPSRDSKFNKTLILDLDQTLVSSSLSQFPGADLKVKIKVGENNQKNVWVKFRPGFRIFLKETSELFEIIFFTSSSKEYSNVILDFIDTQSQESIRLFRENCSVTNSPRKEIYKDLSQLNRPLDSVIHIDNNSKQFRRHKENGIEIQPFHFFSNDDNVLLKLLPFLRFISGVKDVRPVEQFIQAFYGKKEIKYLDVNGMENIFQWGNSKEEEDRLATERSLDNNIDKVLWDFSDDEDSKEMDDTEDEEEENKNEDNDQNNCTKDEASKKKSNRQIQMKAKQKLQNHKIQKYGNNNKGMFGWNLKEFKDQKQRRFPFKIVENQSKQLRDINQSNNAEQSTLALCNNFNPQKEILQNHSISKKFMESLGSTTQTLNPDNSQALLDREYSPRNSNTEFPNSPSIRQDEQINNKD